jgi:hypothetical protein
MYRSVGRVLVALVCGVGALSVSACSGESSDGEGPDEPSRPTADATPAAEICDGTLSDSAAESLEKVSGQREFTELDGLPRAKLDDFARLLRRPGAFRETFCNIYTPVHGPNPFATIDFRWVTMDSPSDFPTPGDEGGKIFYATGESAYVEDDAAIITFPCPIREASPDEYLDAYLFTPQPSATDYESGDPMSIINSISRAVAEELGCLEGSGLAEGTPRRITQ